MSTPSWCPDSTEQEDMVTYMFGLKPFPALAGACRNSRKLEYPKSKPCPSLSLCPTGPAQAQATYLLGLRLASAGAKSTTPFPAQAGLGEPFISWRPSVAISTSFYLGALSAPAQTKMFRVFNTESAWYKVA